MNPSLFRSTAVGFAAKLKFMYWRSSVLLTSPTYSQSLLPVARSMTKNALPLLLFCRVSYPPPTNATNFSLLPIFTRPMAGSDHVSPIFESVKLHRYVGGVHGIRDVQGVVVAAASSQTEDDDRPPGAPDLDVGGDRTAVHKVRVYSKRDGRVIQVVELVLRDEGPELRAVALSKRVEHPVIGAGDQHLRPVGVSLLERLIAGVVQRHERRRDEDRRRMEDVAKLP